MSAFPVRMATLVRGPSARGCVLTDGTPSGSTSVQVAEHPDLPHPRTAGNVTCVSSFRRRQRVGALVSRCSAPLVLCAPAGAGLWPPRPRVALLRRAAKAPGGEELLRRE